MASNLKRKQDDEVDDEAELKKVRLTEENLAAEQATPSSSASDASTKELQTLLDLSGLTELVQITERFKQIAQAIILNHHMVVSWGGEETAFQIIELEFYYLKGVCHEDPFTHGSEEQKISGRWYFHRAPQFSKDSTRSATSTSMYRAGSRKGMDLTFGGPVSETPQKPSSDVLLRGGILLRSIRNVSTGKITSGPSLLVDQVLSHCRTESITEVVDEQWGGDIYAFHSPPTQNKSLLYLKRVNTQTSASSSTGTTSSAKPQNALSMLMAPKPAKLYSSPRIGLELSHPGTEPSAKHPRVAFLSRPYRYFIQPHLLTDKGRAQTFVGILHSCLEGGVFTLPENRQNINTKTGIALKREISKISGIREPTVEKYISEYMDGLENKSKLKSFVGAQGKNAASSPATYLRMVGTVEAVLKSQSS
ncbi:hypothetical protein BDN72DRAFT_789383 [Pluteus cervinus]|uniref:Uncharacterized protein n=1 Tax=Pluteus cervinus TaxID=181527 RepID=A0ACD3BAA8_9AGAR|nr:hypothetical protein BDN72DRAFT_789383 [Pluteus cervinus]